MKADAAAQREDMKAKINKRTDQLDAKAAAKDADWAEDDAAEAIDYAVWMVYDAQLAVLDALDARVYADERAKDRRHVDQLGCQVGIAPPGTLRAAGPAGDGRRCQPALVTAWWAAP